LGGFEGRVLKSGDVLEVGADGRSSASKFGYEVPDHLRILPSAHHAIRIVSGLCNYLLDEKSKNLLTSELFTVSTEANRTGYRLTGHQLSFVEREQPFGAGSDPSNVVNLGYPVGSLQVPSGAELICLMRDAVTGGGYATLATVISVDLDILAQMKFPETVAFEAVSLDVALRSRADRRERLRSLVQMIDPAK
jgi:allophanate hydrolase subunit 2